MIRKNELFQFMNFLPNTHQLKRFFFILAFGCMFFEVYGWVAGIHSPVISNDAFLARMNRPFYSTHLAYLLYAVLGLLLLLAFFRGWSYRFARERFRLEKIINERTEEMIREKDKTEKLLSNVLPKDTAHELKMTGKATRKKYNMVTVLFSDIQGFTQISEQMNPEVLIDELDRIFFHFDSVMEKYNIEKIKTIGDAYMCAGGIPEKNCTNPVDVVMAALEMQKYITELQEKSEQLGKKFWDIRIGIHTGSVIAGVVGQKKLSYDIWGDTVNTASRMESSGEPGKINISGSTYAFVKDFFICEYRGKMPVKYKGEIDMYFVKGIRPELAREADGAPNENFLIQLQTLRLNDLENEIVRRFETATGIKLYFHTVKHTLQVYTQAELLGRAYGIPLPDMLILRTAALIHDIGMLEDYFRHSEAGCEMARDILSRYKYDPAQIEKICRLIMSLHDTSPPGELLEQILHDAEYDYVGRVDFIPLCLELYREELAYGKAGLFEEWKQHQMEFLSSHRFYTGIAERLREVKKEKQLASLRELKWQE